MRKKLLLTFTLISFFGLSQSDDCSGATALAVGAGCTTTAFANNENGQPEVGAPIPSCQTGTASSDVWYSVNVGTTGNVQITLSGTDRNACLAAYSNCPAVTLVTCTNVAAAASGSIIFSATAGVTYYIQIMRTSGGGNANMSGSICAQTVSSAAPANDNCAGAISLTPGASCTQTATTSLNATNSATTPNPACANYSASSQDVWYKAVVPASGSINFETFANSLSDAGMAIYTGASCASLTLQSCDDDSGTGLMPAISATLTPGATVYVRVWGYSANVEGTFGICATAGATATGNQNCASGTQICSDASFSGNSNNYASQELNSTNQGCLSTEHQSSWYYFSPTSTGTISLSINPASGVDYDFAIWGPYNSLTCPVNTAPLRCSFASGFTSSFETGSYNTGLGTAGVGTVPSGNAVDVTDGGVNDDLDGWVDPITVGAANVNKYYVMLIDNFTANATPFNIDFTLTCGLNCTPLPIELVDFNVYQKQTGNLLKWSTMSERDNDYFVIQKSYDGENWFEVTTVDGAGNTTTKQNYSFLDTKIKPTVCYYKLSQVDYNGERKEHSIITIDNTNKDIYLVKRVNQLGQEVDESYNGLILEVYSDGSIQKKLQ